MSDEHKQHTHPEGGETPASESAAAGTSAPAGDKEKTTKDSGKKKGGGKKEKAEKKPKAPQAPKDGVIKTILETMQRDEGATANEIADILAAKFKDRTRDGMLTTIRIQVSRLPQRLNFELKKSNIEGRGLVYKAPKSVRLDKPKKEKAPAAGEGGDKK